MTLIWSSALWLFRRLCGIPGRRPTPPPNVCRLRGTPPQVSTSAAALRTASDGRHGQGVRADWSGASHSRSRTARPASTEHRASRASAQAATRRSLPGHRTQPDQIGPCRLQLQMQPQRHRARSFIHPEIGISFAWLSGAILEINSAIATISARSGRSMASCSAVP